MTNNILKLLVILLYIYLLFCQTKENDYLQMILLTLFTGIFLCKVDKVNNDVLDSNGFIEGNTCNASKLIEGNTCQKHQVEGMTADNGREYKAQTQKMIDQTNKVAEEATEMKPKQFKMSHYDGICLKSGNNESWFGGPDDVPFVPDDELYTFFSSQAPLKAVRTDNSKTQGNPIDGVPGSPEKMFMLANNRSSPYCCPSTFSTSTGCICTSKNQRDYISKRGINHQSSEE